MKILVVVSKENDVWAVCSEDYDLGQKLVDFEMSHHL